MNDHGITRRELAWGLTQLALIGIGSFATVVALIYLLDWVVGR